ncbi:MAG: TRAP transporter substrate-binding protein [Burkholderiaceae bacterium]|jgi:tripartite ATP-independent transporter DctP family solute receptor|nr:TRAP transporter substrate-binding protein [Burkholderiaceae bacterium]
MKPFQLTHIKPLRALLAVLAVGAAALAVSAAQAATYSPHIIRFGYGLVEQSNQGRAARFMAADLAKRTGGKLNMKTFGSASLGSDIQMQNALIGGAQEMMTGSTTTLVGIVDDFGVFDLPFLFANDKEADTVLDGPIGQRLLDKLQAKGLVGLVFNENGFRDITNSKRPITKMEDFKGLKLRVMQNPMYIDLFNSLGANAIPLSFSDLFTALESHTVDGQDNPINTDESSKFYEVQKYLTISHHVYTPFIVLASKQWWDTLNPDEQAAIKASAAAARDYERQDTRAESARILEQLKTQGMQVNVISEPELARMRVVARPVIDKFAASSPAHAQLVKDIEAELAKLRGQK